MTPLIALTCVQIVLHVIIIVLIVVAIFILHKANRLAIDTANKAITRVELIKSMIEDAVKGSVDRFAELEKKIQKQQ